MDRRAFIAAVPVAAAVLRGTRATYDQPAPPSVMCEKQHKLMERRDVVGLYCPFCDAVYLKRGWVHTRPLTARARKA